MRVFLLLGGLPPMAVQPHLPRAVWFSGAYIYMIYVCIYICAYIYIKILTTEEDNKIR